MEHGLRVRFHLKSRLCFFFFQSTADAAKQARLPFRGDKFTFTRKLVWTVRTWSKAAEANAQKYRGLFNARAKRL